MWLTAGRRGRYQAILLNDPNVSLKTASKLNPASLLPKPDSTALIYDCVNISAVVYSSRNDVQDHPPEEADWTLCTGGSSYTEKGSRKAGYEVVTLEGVAEAQALPPGTSAQKAELIVGAPVVSASARYSCRKLN